MKTIKDTMLETMVSIYDKVTAQQEENGKSLFKDGTFVIYGQCTGIYYARLYTYAHPCNPYYRKRELLDRAIKSWDYYLTLLDKHGRTHIITYDHSWGYMYEEWNTLHLLNTIELLKEFLPEEKLEKYQDVVERACQGILEQTRREFQGEYRKNIINHTVANHFLWCLTLCYRFGQLRGKEEILTFCDEVLDDVCQYQLPFGTWLEGGSLVVEYAHTTLGALALYSFYAGNQNKNVYHAVIKNMRYLLNCYYDNFSPIGCIDTRNRYELFNGFPYIPGAFATDAVGLDYISKHVKGLCQNPEYLLRTHQMLGFYTAFFDSVPDDVILKEDAAEKTENSVIEIDRLEQVIPAYSDEKCNTIVIKEKGFSIPVCILTQKLYHSRWILERQNLYSIYYRDRGVIVGGGHSIASPEFSCFNVISAGKLYYMHSKAKFLNPKQIQLVYGGIKCEISFLIEEHQVRVRYRADGLKDTEKVVVNAPVFTRYAQRIVTPQGKELIPSKLEYGKYKCGQGTEVRMDDTKLSFDRLFYAEYPVFAYNSYVQEQVEDFNHAFMIMSTVLDDKHPEAELTVAIG